jgi:hypothetical protein
VVQGKIAHQCHGAHQACEDDVLPYCTMAYWVHALKNSRDNMKDKSCTVCPVSAAGTAGQVTGIGHTRNLPNMAGISVPMLLCILHDKRRMRNTAIRWVLHSLSKIQMWAWRQSMYILSST